MIKAGEILQVFILYSFVPKQMIFEGFDLNSGDFIDLIKFQEIIEVINARYTEDEIKELFNIFEINKDGKISVQQLQQLLQ